MGFKCQYTACCQSADAVEGSVPYTKANASTPPVSDDSMTVESVVEEDEEQKSSTDTNVRTIMEKESVETKSFHSVPIVGASKEVDADTPPVSDRSVASKSVVEGEAEEKNTLAKQNSLTTTSLRSAASKQADADTSPVSDRSVASKSVTKEEEKENYSFATTSLRSVVDAIIGTSKQEDADTPPVSDCSVPLGSVAKDEEDEQNSSGKNSDCNSNSLRSNLSSAKSDRSSAIEEDPGAGLVPIVDASKQAAADTPPVSDRSVASKSGVEEVEDGHNSLTKTSVRSIIKEDTAIPIIDTSKETDANIPAVADNSVTLEAAVEKEEKVIVMTKNNVISIAEEDIAEKEAEKASYNCFYSVFCCDGKAPETATASKTIAS